MMSFPMQGVTLSTEIEGQLCNLTLREFHITPTNFGFHSLNFQTNNIDIFSRYYRCPMTHDAVIFVSEKADIWNSPQRTLFPRLGEHMVVKKMSSLLITFRYPHQFGDSVLDIMAGVMFLQSQGIQSFSLVGYGSATSALLQAASLIENVNSLIIMAPDVQDPMLIRKVQSQPALILHGQRDETTSVAHAQYMHTLFSGPKDLVIYPSSRHLLNDVQPEIFNRICSWLSIFGTTHYPFEYMVS